MHFILHTGFGGSTLLARYLEALPSCLVLKEPMLLGELSTQWNEAPPGREPKYWRDWFQVAFALLARGYPSDDAVVVKVPDCNWMGHLLLDQDERTKIIFLGAPSSFSGSETTRPQPRRSTCCVRHHDILRRANSPTTRRDAPLISPKRRLGTE